LLLLWRKEVGLTFAASYEEFINRNNIETYYMKAYIEFPTTTLCEILLSLPDNILCVHGQNILHLRLPVSLIPASYILTLGPDDNRTAAQETLLPI